MPVSVKFWQPNDDVGNFGDSLTLLYMDRVFEPVSRFRFGAVYLVGSVTTDSRIGPSRTEGHAGGDGCGKQNRGLGPPPGELAP